MAFTRNFLKSLGLTDEQVQAVVEEHTAVTDSLKRFKEDAEKLPSVQKELDDLKESTKDYDEWKKKYNDEHSAFEDFKKNIETESTLNKMKNAYKALLKANNVDEKRWDAIIRVTDFSEKKLDKDGKFTDESKLVDSIKSEWGDFVVTSGAKGTGVENPPANNPNDALSTNADYIRKRASMRHAGTYGEIKTDGKE